MNSTIKNKAPRLLATGAIVGSLLTVPVTAAATPTQACVEDEGVTVVVDFTDLGGEVEIGCAPGEPENGREALEGAGFSPEDSMPGMVCTINNLPDPCPEEFDGDFWSYWSGEDDDWAMYDVGLDEATPEPGDVEGWRYSDGSEGPTITPTEALAEAGESDGDEATEGEDTDGDNATVDSEDDSSAALPTWAFVVVAVAIIGGVVALVVRRRQQ